MYALWLWTVLTSVVLCDKAFIFKITNLKQNHICTLGRYICTLHSCWARRLGSGLSHVSFYVKLFCASQQRYIKWSHMSWHDRFKWGFECMWLSIAKTIVWNMIICNPLWTLRRLSSIYLQVEVNSLHAVAMYINCWQHLMLYKLWMCHITSGTEVARKSFPLTRNIHSKLTTITPDYHHWNTEADAIIT